MPRKTVTSWTFDPSRQELRSPAGFVVSVREIAQLLADRHDCRHNFAGAWAGWKMRGDRLIPPHSGRSGPVLKPDTAPKLAAWIAEAQQPKGEDRRGNIGSPCTPRFQKPPLRLVKR